MVKYEYVMVFNEHLDDDGDENKSLRKSVVRYLSKGFEIVSFSDGDGFTFLLRKAAKKSSLRFVGLEAQEEERNKRFAEKVKAHGF